MSLYNMVHGFHPLASIILKALDLDPSNIPRFQDARPSIDDDTGKLRLMIYTRTGGGNRDFHESEASCRANYPEYFTGENDPTGLWNEDLRAVPGFVSDEDDAFDSTYAKFFYEVPDEFQGIFDTLRSIDTETAEPDEKWKKLIADLNSGGTSPAAERARDVGRQLMKALGKPTE